MVSLLDKSWMMKSKTTSEYFEGCKFFVEFAWSNKPAEYGPKIYCPCVRCNNQLFKKKDEVLDHIRRFGILRSYTCWTKHGESEVANVLGNDGDDMHGMLRDAFTVHSSVEVDSGALDEHDAFEYDPNVCSSDEPNKDAQTFFKYLKDAETPLFPGSVKSTKLSFLVRLLLDKCINGWSNKSFDMLLKTLKDSFPDDVNIPKNYYEAKKLLKDLGMECIKIDACRNDCMLYWKDDINKNECDVCGESRWKLEACQNNENDVSLKKPKKKAAKILRYFPLKPRLQRLYMCSQTSKDMRWHDESRTKDGILRHPADTRAWKALDEKYPLFAMDPRNVRLGLASDGFNPFGNLSTTHSIWPVVLIPYNLPPWLCMKQTHFILSTLIPGPSSPGNNIDVYLQPLIEELKELWINGIATYDAHLKQNFQMHAAVLWTINDFPAYANLSGWSTKGSLACPRCHKYTCSERLHHGKKYCYMGHRRFLERSHKFRKNTTSFNGNVETGHAPIPLTGIDVLEELRGYDQVTFGKAEHDKFGRKRKRDDYELPYNWKKISIFLTDLPYWKDNLLPNNLDVMHIEKNNGESWVGTLFDIDGKTKDGLKARQDMEIMGIRGPLHAIPRGDNKFYIPPACYTLSLQEKKKICQFLHDVKVPDSYSSNISRRVQVKQCKIIGLKSHDWHVLVQQLLPVAARGILRKEVMAVLVEFSNFYKKLCSKTLVVTELEKLQSQIAITLCKMEMIFPPSFFDIMVHLPIHLAGEALVAGPVHYRWMYPIESYLYTLKKYVRSRSNPEASIAQGYFTDECLTFFSRYLNSDIETKFTRTTRNNEGFRNATQAKLPIFMDTGRALGAASPRNLNDEDWDQARLYVLRNCDEVLPFVEKHKQSIREGHVGRIREIDLERSHNETFAAWFELHVRKMKEEGQVVNDQLDILSMGPSRSVCSYTGYIINGFRFHTKDRERMQKTQNSGVFVNANTRSFANAKDTNSVVESVGYYGVLCDVVELKYLNGNRVVLFKCNWWDVMSRAGIKQDEYGFTSLNFKRTLRTNEPFVLVTQVEQVFYVQDNLNADWRVVLRAPPRDLYDIGCQLQPIQADYLHTHEATTETVDTIEPTESSWTRDEINGNEVELNIIEGDSSNTDLVEE